MVSSESLEILRCPNCVREKNGLLTLYKEAWLICQDCGRKYPIVDEIPVMLIDEGDKWINTAQDALPIPPPANKVTGVTALQDLLADLASGNDIRAEHAIPAIAKLGAVALPALVELTNHPSADSRWWAVYALAALPEARTEHLLPLLEDPAPEVRAAAALAICGHAHESAVPQLISLLGDEDDLVAGLAGNALVKIGSPSVPALIEVLTLGAVPGRDEAPLRVRILALRALAEIRDPRAIPVMMSSMSEASAVLQYWAQAGLERLGLDMVYINP